MDIVAIKMKCCGLYYACKDCHEALAGHDIVVWPRGEWHARAVLCGACGVEMTIRKYMECESRCPACGARFSSVFAVDCEACGSALRPNEQFGVPIRRPT